MHTQGERPLLAILRDFTTVMERPAAAARPPVTPPGFTIPGVLTAGDLKHPAEQPDTMILQASFQGRSGSEKTPG